MADKKKYHPGGSVPVGRRKTVTKRPNVDPSPTPRKKRAVVKPNVDPRLPRRKVLPKLPNELDARRRPPKLPNELDARRPPRRKTVAKKPNVDPRPLPIRKKAGPRGQPAIPVEMQRKLAAQQARRVRSNTNSRNLPTSMQKRLAAQRRLVNQKNRSNANSTLREVKRPSSRGNAPRPRSLREVAGKYLSRLRGRR